jgi:glycosyltransferase involved in cell wall biosynthesis
MGKTKKILIFSLAYQPLIGGAEVAVREITNRINPEDFEFDMITLKFENKMPSFEKIGNLNIYRVGSSKLFFPFVAWLKASRLHRKNKYDAIWSIMANYAGFAALFFKLTHSKIPFLLTLQEGDPIEYIKRRARFVYPLFKRIFTKADRISAISYYLASWAKNMGFKGSVEVVPNGVDVSIFTQMNNSTSSNYLTEKLKKGENDKFIITTSRLVRKNAVKDIIEALKFLPNEVKFLILGTGVLEDKLRQQVKDLNLEERVKFIGYVDYKDIPNYLKTSDVFVRPSLSEGFGNSFIEAMAAGIPVIATPVGGIVDFLKDGETGLFCEVSNPKSIAEKVEQILDDENLRNHLIQNAKKMAIEKYDWDLVAKQMKEKVFNKLWIVN